MNGPHLSAKAAAAYALAKCGYLKALNAELVAKCEKVITWLDRLAATAEQAAKDDRFPSLQEARLADAKNYRAVANDIRAVVAKAKAKGAAA